MALAAARVKDFRVNPAPVITNPQTQLPGFIRDINLDVKAIGVAKRVGYGLAPDGIDFFRIKGCSSRAVPSTTTVKDAALSCAASWPASQQRLCKVTRPFDRRAQIVDALSPFNQHLVGSIQGIFQCLARGLLRWNLLCRGVKSKNQALNALQERVMQFARNALSLTQTLFRPRANFSGHLAHSQEVKQPQDNDKRASAESREPECLEKCRCHTKVYRCAGFIPDTVVVARRYVEAIFARLEVAVKRLTTGLGFLPVRVVSLQLVTKQHLLRNNKAWGGVVDFKISSERGQSNVLRTMRIADTIRNDPFYKDTGRQRVFPERFRIKLL